MIVYLVYTVVVFLINTYLFKEMYSDALVKSILSGIVFTFLYAFFVMRNEKRNNEAKK
jgi:hypothetical protein